MVISLQRSPKLFLEVYSADFSDKGDNVERAAVRVPQRGGGPSTGPVKLNRWLRSRKSGGNNRTTLWEH